MNELLTTITVLSCCLFGTAQATESVANTPVTETEFQIMTTAEMQQHQEIMANLQGAQREAYRNQQYQLLRNRARDHGYILPPFPVWNLPVDPHAKEMQAFREQHRKSAEAYRKEMRQRFDDFMTEQHQPAPRQVPAPQRGNPYWGYPQSRAPYPYPPPPAPGYWQPMPGR